MFRITMKQSPRNRLMSLVQHVKNVFLIFPENLNFYFSILFKKILICQTEFCNIFVWPP